MGAVCRNATNLACPTTNVTHNQRHDRSPLRCAQMRCSRISCLVATFKCMHMHVALLLIALLLITLLTGKTQKTFATLSYVRDLCQPVHGEATLSKQIDADCWETTQS